LGVRGRRVEEEVEAARDITDSGLDSPSKGNTLRQWERKVEVAVSSYCLGYAEEECFDVE